MDISPRLFIRDFSSVSSLGYLTGEKIDWKLNRSFDVSGAAMRWGFPVFILSQDAEAALATLCSARHDRCMDRVTQLALLAAAPASAAIRNSSHVEKIGVSIGSSRGATGALEQSLALFSSTIQKLPEDATFTRGSASLAVDTSPSTTAGGIASAVAQHILASTEQSSIDTTVNDIGSPLVLVDTTSMTCSSSFQALLTGIAFLRANMADAWVFGGAEAPITPYTLSMMDALKVYSEFSHEWPCRPGVLEQLVREFGDGKRSSFVLGEGAGAGVLVKSTVVPRGAQFEVLGIGSAIEKTPSPTGISSEGSVFYYAMRSALQDFESRGGGNSGADLLGIDAVIAHSPGTRKGDAAEMCAIERCFGAALGNTEKSVSSSDKQVRPRVVSSKHLTGHAFGAAGMVSLELARQMALGASLPYVDHPSAVPDTGREGRPPYRFLINTGGFGGCAVSLLVEFIG